MIIFKRTLTVLICFLLIASVLCGCQGEQKVLHDFEIGEEDGYGYELWKDHGDTTMTLTGGGTFSCEWSNINNALFRRGKKFDCTQTWREIGNIKVEYEVDYQPDGNSYFCVYGWTREPLVEYYVVESWGNWRPPGGNPIATITVDGGLYDVYKSVRVNQPSIDGNTTFVQYWSVRQEKKTEGEVNLSTHFAAWEALGLPMGKMYEASLTVEGYQSQGSAVVKKNKLTVGGEIIEPNPDDLPKPIEPDENGNYICADFESGKDGWGSRGSSKVSSDGSAAYSGSKSLAVSGRADAWNGTEHDLNSSVFKAGETFRFSVMAMQEAVDSTEFKLTIQYIDAYGGTSYDCIAQATGAKGEWVELKNEAYTLPEGAWNILLYVETDSGTHNFYIDDAVVGK